MMRTLLLLSGLSLAACGGPSTGLKSLKHSSITYPYSGPVRLYIATERDRSGAGYFAAVKDYELTSFRERFSHGLQFRKLRLDTYTSAGNPVTLKLKNPFEIVADSTLADITLYLQVDAFERGEVTVTRDRLTLWYGYGIAQTWADYDRVSRAMVAIDAQLKDMKTGQLFYNFYAKGISVGDEVRRQSFMRAMDRCETRFYEKLLRR